MNQEATMQPAAVTPQQTFEAALADFVCEAQRVCDKNNERFTSLPNERVYVDEQRGNTKYVRLMLRNSVYGFVRIADGAILYAAGWKKPFIAKGGPNAPATVRGSIYDATTWAGVCGPYAVLTVRR